MQISDQIIQVLDYLGEKLGVTIDWSQANVMPYIETLCTKYIRYEIATSIMWMAVGAALIVSVIWWRRMHKRCMDLYREKGYLSNWNEAASGCMTAAVICIFLGIVTILAQAHDIMRCVLLPEAQIYAYIKSMM